MTTKHTPGPWSAIQVYSDAVTVVDANGFEIVEAESIAILSEYSEKLKISHWGQSKDSHRVLSEEEQAANAHLIAAAPELLEALGVVMHLCDIIGAPDGPALDMARAAIAKAKGEQQ